MLQSIVTTVNGTSVHGIITHHTPYDITIEITQPFSGFTTGCHIPCLTRKHIHYIRRKGQGKSD